MPLEVALIPEHAFVEEDVLVLRIPIGGDRDRGRLGEVIFQQLAAARPVKIAGVAFGAGLGRIIAPAIAIRIDNVVPWTVEAGRRPVVDVHQQCGWTLSQCRAGEDDEGESQTAQIETATRGKHTALRHGNIVDCQILSRNAEQIRSTPG